MQKNKNSCKEKGAMMGADEEMGYVDSGEEIVPDHQALHELSDGKLL
jgi:membrane-associated phospholipid phosphatase